ncbi:MAG: HAD-IA family hydrolase [Propionibacteriaceae bacterium]|nr:HAD-IA family hydrolase [Propionibacteriaceae bacterium]
MTTARWSTVLFDFDGTLANTIPLILASYRWTIEQHDLPRLTDEQIRATIGRTLPDMMTELGGPERAAELMDAYSAWQRDNVTTYLEAYAGIDALLADLGEAGVRIGVATSRRRESAESLAAVLGLDVPVLAALDDTLEHKPLPAPLLFAAERIGSLPADCAYIGDAVVDLQAADAAGMAGIGVTWGAGDPDALRAEPSFAVVDTVDDLRAALLGNVSPQS